MGNQQAHRLGTANPTNPKRHGRRSRHAFDFPHIGVSMPLVLSGLGSPLKPRSRPCFETCQLGGVCASVSDSPRGTRQVSCTLLLRNGCLPSPPAIGDLLQHPPPLPIGPIMDTRSLMSLMAFDSILHEGQLRVFLDFLVPVSLCLSCRAHPEHHTILSPLPGLAHPSGRTA